MSTESSRIPQTQALSPWATLGSVTDKVTSAIFSKTPLWWWIGFLISSALAAVFVFLIGNILVQGVGIWNINVPVVWGIAIINLVFWIGIGHAGTFISAFLLLMRQHWRGTFSRFAEAMTLFAVATAGLFPLIHLGRIQFFYWLLPYPNILVLNPQWRSALVWDAIAIGTYGIISLLFWFIDLLPDLAAMRDKAEPGLVKTLYGAAAMGWRGDSAHWNRLHTVTYVLAALATPLVISVHSVVGLDFAISILPGWHHTIFPPYFVAGAILSGFAMVIIVAIGLRNGFGMQELISIDHLENAAKMVLLTGFLVGYGYAFETFGAWYTGHTEEVLLIVQRAIGPYAGAFWGMVIFNTLVVQLLWFRNIRRSQTWLMVISVLVLVGMWLERFVIISVSLVYQYLPSMWEQFNPGLWDWLTIISPFGFFFALFFLFIRLLPILPIFETQQIAVEEGGL